MLIGSRDLAIDTPSNIIFPSAPSYLAFILDLQSLINLTQYSVKFSKNHNIPSDVESSYNKGTTKCVPEGRTNDQFTKLESSLTYHLIQNAWVPYSSQTSAPEF